MVKHVLDAWKRSSQAGPGLGSAVSRGGGAPPGRADGEVRTGADEYREDVPAFDERRDRAARALGLDSAGLPSAATALARLVELARGPVAAECLVAGCDGDPLAPHFDSAPLPVTPGSARQFQKALHQELLLVCGLMYEF